MFLNKVFENYVLIDEIKKMIVKDPTKFCDIIDCLKQLEIEINERIIDYYKKI